MCRWGACGAGFPGASTAWNGIPALRAKAAIGRPPSPIRWLSQWQPRRQALFLWKPRRPEAGPRRRSRPSGRGRRRREYCPDRAPDAWPCPASFARGARQIGPSAFEGFEDEGLVRFDRSRLSFAACGEPARAETDARQRNGRRRMNAAQLRGLGQALALDHRPGVIEPFSPSCADAPSASWSAH